MLLQIQDDEFLNAEGSISSGRGPRDSNDDASSSSERPNHSIDAPAEVFLLSIFKLKFHLPFPVEYFHSCYRLFSYYGFHGIYMCIQFFILLTL